MGNLTQGGSASASPEPVVIFEGDISAQTAADRVLTLNFDLPETGWLFVTGDTAQLDTDPQIDTPGRDLIPFPMFPCFALHRIPGITEAQAQEVVWTTYPKVALGQLTLSQFPAETSESSPYGVGIYLSRITGEARKLGAKVGNPSQSNATIFDYSPLTIYWIP